MFLVFLLLGSALAMPKKEINVELHGGEFYEFTGYPWMEQGYEVIYHFSTSPNSNVQFFCKDIRVYGGRENPCDKVKVSFDDGTKKESFCARTFNGRFSYVSNANKATVGIRFKVWSSIHCVARTTEEPKPTIAHLDPNQRPYKFEKRPQPFGEDLEYGDLLWELHSKKGSRVSLQCRISFAGGHPCEQDSFTIDNGNEVKTFCGGHKNIVEFSAGQKMKVRARLDDIGKQSLNCTAKCV